eukprot:CAMPEP_0172513306 /NCGR_PEP_ID=MMETSP1066-20121228/251570_1 /TAXON_ID=671091 /ORGANISM="Coscinodiscus wailesii, Strain CCMP2513" /LENGTH=37 /DNA_ID= /DNA_START= /DNA_END= /DNA_ORIENTATION=
MARGVNGSVAHAGFEARVIDGNTRVFTMPMFAEEDWV